MDEVFGMVPTKEVEMRKHALIFTTAAAILACGPIAAVPKLPLPKLQAPNRVPPPSRKRKTALRTASSVITAE